jgi:TATA-box binding protein (TBP) (component of TFIID and TFIIIB)
MRNNLKIQINNVISTADLRQRVEITKFNDFSWGRYDIENNYNGKVGYVKPASMQGRVTVFLSGKLISTGAKSLLKSSMQLNKTMDLLAKNDFIKSVELVPKVRNIVAVIDFDKTIDINALATLVPKIIYEPDQFPGAVLRTSQGPACLIFSSGKVVIVGSKSEEELLSCSRMLKKTLIMMKVI